MRTKGTKTASAGTTERLPAATPMLVGTAAPVAYSAASASLPAAANAVLGTQPEAAAKPEAAGKPAAKQRVKASDLNAAGVDVKVAEKAAAGRLGELTVPEAKCWLKERKLPLKGKKEDLIARIREHMGSNAG